MKTRTKNIGVVILIIAVVVAGIFYIYHEINVASTNKMRLESIVGQSLTKSREQLEKISKLQELNNSNIQLIQNELTGIQVHYSVIDKAVGVSLLAPISDELKTKFEDISSIYQGSQQLSEEGIKEFNDYKNKLVDLSSIINETYYESSQNHPEGGGVNLNITDYQELAKFRQNF
ncbi:hypothetical protein PVOR_25343 [Paenibacillus vortex V453]|uniref:Uncharacterized protein n=1 Tax=Paenibacillus vortex V453 TaxID=715225 RepID=A0A2R9SPR2_9BACL|nr:hypothetical protein [Paenibacillus vortex]EFU39344.1 hypothetical protein PVOR_25343 [Paenibacillus vortex V453]